MVKATWRIMQERVARALKTEKPKLEKGQRTLLSGPDFIVGIRHRRNAPEWLTSGLYDASLYADGRQTPLGAFTTDEGRVYLIIPMGILEGR